MQTFLVILVIGGVLFLCVWVLIRAFKHEKKVVAKENQRIIEAKEQYDQALKSGDKKVALEAGRKYYTLLRRGKFSPQDEQAITNDLMTMK